MRDIFAACTAFFQGLAQTSNALLDFILAVVEFNFQVVSGILYTLARACDAINTFANFTAAVALETLLYAWKVLGNISVFLGKCGIVLGQICLGLKHVVLHIIEGLGFVIHGVQYAILCFLTAVIKLITLPWYLLCLFYGSIRTSFWEAWSTTYYAAAIVCSGISQAVEGAVKLSVDCTQAAFYAFTDLLMKVFISIHSTCADIKNSAIKIYRDTPKELYVYTAVFIVCACAINWILNYLHARGLTLPFIQYHSHVQFQLRDEDEDVFSDNSDAEGVEFDIDPDEMSVNSDADNDSSSGEEGEIVEEYEVVTDSDSVLDEDEEVEVIDIQLPKRTAGYNLRRNRATPQPTDKLTPDELERVLGNEREKRTCVVCQDQVKTVLVLPCRHMCLCVECAHEITAQRNSTRRICPLCRTRMQTVMNIYV